MIYYFLGFMVSCNTLGIFDPIICQDLNQIFLVLSLKRGWTNGIALRLTKIQAKHILAAGIGKSIQGKSVQRQLCLGFSRRGSFRVGINSLRSAAKSFFSQR